MNLQLQNCAKEIFLVAFERRIGYEADWFDAHLVRLFHKADLENRERLSQGFPEMAIAFSMWSESEHDFFENWNLHEVLHGEALAIYNARYRGELTNA